MKWFRGCIGVLAIGCVLLQYLTPPAVAEDMTPLVYTFRYLSFFTIQSNLLAGLVLLLPLFSSARLARWLDGPLPRVGAVLYLAVTGLVYFTLLRHVWDPKGLAYVADRGLHYVGPSLAAIEWWFFASKQGLTLRQLPRLLIFPAVYFAYTLAVGAISGYYPYPFINAQQLGYPQVLLTGLALLGLFVLLGAILIRFAQVRAR